MHLMQPLLTTELKQSDDFLYEIKYDGFRALLDWNKTDIQLISRKHTTLTNQFPEIIHACKELRSTVEQLLPIQLDGELVILNNKYQANFPLLQKRGRMRSGVTIDQTAKRRPATLMVFDVLMWQGKSVKQETLLQRKQLLHTLFASLSFSHQSLQEVPVYTAYETVKQHMHASLAEGVLGKRKKSIYIPGKQHRDWLKEKNWRTIYGFLTVYYPDNGYFRVGVFDQKEIQIIGHCKHGLTDKERKTVQRIFVKEGTWDGTAYTLLPAVCVAIHTLGVNADDLREPNFITILPNMDPGACTAQRLQTDLAMFPESIAISNVEKWYWPDAMVSKNDLLIYMRTIFPYMFPYMNQRALTIIRCPEGIEETCFFQKHMPAYGPDTMKRADEKIVCEKMEALFWLANHGAVEYHTPFNRINSTCPDTIVFDLDPPSADAFPMALETARLFRNVFETLELTTFIKTSGNKGLQIHIPLPHGKITYEETGMFTKRLAYMLVEAAPELCTMERMKTKRQGKLYIDYVQHGKKKTIIAPYSPRKNPRASIATPLDWSEINEELSPDQFTIHNVLERIQHHGCPWYAAYEAARNQSLEKAEPLFQK